MRYDNVQKLYEFPKVDRNVNDRLLRSKRSFTATFCFPVIRKNSTFVFFYKNRHFRFVKSSLISSHTREKNKKREKGEICAYSLAGCGGGSETELGFTVSATIMCSGVFLLKLEENGKILQSRMPDNKHPEIITEIATFLFKLRCMTL